MRDLVGRHIVGSAAEREAANESCERSISSLILLRIGRRVCRLMSAGSASGAIPRPLAGCDAMVPPSTGFTVAARSLG